MLGIACVIMVITLVAYALIWRVWTDQPYHDTGATSCDPGVDSSQLQGVFVVMLLMNAAWICGLLTARLGGVGLEIAFCVLNILLGVAVCVVHCVLYKEAQQAWKQLFNDPGMGSVGRRSGRRTGDGSPNMSDTSIAGLDYGRDVFAAQSVITGSNPNTWYKHGGSPRPRRERRRSSLKYGRSSVTFGNTLEPPTGEESPTHYHTPSILVQAVDGIRTIDNRLKVGEDKITEL